MLWKQWQDYALKAKQIAKHIVTGLEQNKKGVRLIQIVYGLDMYATDAFGFGRFSCVPTKLGSTPILLPLKILLIASEFLSYFKKNIILLSKFGYLDIIFL